MQPYGQQPQPYGYAPQPYGYSPQPYGYAPQPAPQTYAPMGYAQQPQPYGASPYPPANSPGYIAPAPQISKDTNEDHLRDWSSGLCSFCEDFGVCFGTLLCCPCKTYSTRKVALNKDELTCCERISCLLQCPLTYVGLICFEACAECKNRKELKERLHFKNTSCDCLKTLICMPCVVCQHQREIKFQKKLGNL